MDRCGIRERVLVASDATLDRGSDDVGRRCRWRRLGNRLGFRSRLGRGGLMGTFALRF
jgi:hypothetical protein